MAPLVRVLAGVAELEIPDIDLGMDDGLEGSSSTDEASVCSPPPEEEDYPLPFLLMQRMRQKQNGRSFGPDRWTLPEQARQEACACYTATSEKQYTLRVARSEEIDHWRGAQLRIFLRYADSGEIVTCKKSHANGTPTSASGPNASGPLLVFQRGHPKPSQVAHIDTTVTSTGDVDAIFGFAATSYLHSWRSFFLHIVRRDTGESVLGRLTVYVKARPASKKPRIRRGSAAAMALAAAAAAAEEGSGDTDEAGGSGPGPVTKLVANKRARSAGSPAHAPTTPKSTSATAFAGKVKVEREEPEAKRRNSKPALYGPWVPPSASPLPAVARSSPVPAPTSSPLFRTPSRLNAPPPAEVHGFPFAPLSSFGCAASLAGADDLSSILAGERPPGDLSDMAFPLIDGPAVWGMTPIGSVHGSAAFPVTGIAPWCPVA